MELIRSFIAIELPDELKLALAQLQTQLKTGKHPSVKWVDPGSIHLTLKFLGNISPDKISQITEAMTVAAQEVSPFHLELKGLGAFPNLRRVQVIWVGVEGEVAQLSQLQQRIESNLVPLGFTPQTRAFTPHLTLARLREGASLAEQQSLGQLIASTKFEGAYGFTVDSVNLMRSQLTREGAVYTRLSSVKLKKG
jgi:2'-5' RNA ligase